MWSRMGGWLWALVRTDCWRPGEWHEAECRMGHRIPGDSCDCGLYGFHNVEFMEREFGLPVSSSMGMPAIPTEPLHEARGVIVADGDIIPYSRGFRAQYAKVVAIFDDGAEAIATPQHIAADYRCEVITPGQYDMFCIKHGLRRLDLEWQLTV